MYGVILPDDPPGLRSCYRRRVSSNDLAQRPLGPALPAGLRKRQLLSTISLAVCAVLATVALVSGPYPHPQSQRVLLALVACAPIVALRRWPLPGLVVATAGSTLFIAGSGNDSLPLSIVTGLAMYFAASRLPRAMSVRVALAAGAALVTGMIYGVFTARAPSMVGDAAVACLVPLAAAWFAGDSAAARRRYRAGLAEQEERERAAETERARQDVLEERVRIARELHDVVAHTLAVITVQAGVGRRLMARRPEEAATALESIETIGRTAQDELRVVLGLLRDEEPAAAALAPAPRLTDLKELADTVRASGIPVELRMSGADRQLSPALELSIYRVVQEALTNVVKHAPLARATVGISVSDDDVRLEITDDGGRPDAQPLPARPAAGHGIVGMRERVAAFGGWLTAEPLADRGFRVTAEIPAGGTG
jgi:signal transduction histidine kinase